MVENLNRIMAAAEETEITKKAVDQKEVIPETEMIGEN